MFNRPVFLNQLINFKDKELIKVITGIRRCGKSSLLILFKQYLKQQGISDNNILHMNFESFEYDGLTYKDFYKIVKTKADKAGGRIYLLFDEIQKVDKWELSVNSMRVDLDADIYITGSNAYLLSSQLATYLSGRYAEIKMQPLSFKEFLTFYNLDGKTKEEKFDLYLKNGGMPGLKDLEFNELMINQALEGIFSTVIMKDVINQAPVRDAGLLNKVILFLADNIGNPVSVNNIKNILSNSAAASKNPAGGVIDNYISFLENAFMFYGVKRYDIKGKEYLKTLGKYYIADIGLRNYLLGAKNRDRGHILENIVFLELKHRGYNVFTGKLGDKETDFIAVKPNERKYIQVTETLINPDTRKRELYPLKAAKDNYEKMILTADSFFVNTDEEGIKILNVIDWLLG